MGCWVVTTVVDWYAGRQQAQRTSGSDAMFSNFFCQTACVMSPGAQKASLPAAGRGLRSRRVQRAHGAGGGGGDGGGGSGVWGRGRRRRGRAGVRAPPAPAPGVAGAQEGRYAGLGQLRGEGHDQPAEPLAAARGEEVVCSRLRCRDQGRVIRQGHARQGAVQAPGRRATCRQLRG